MAYKNINVYNDNGFRAFPDRPSSLPVTPSVTPQDGDFTGPNNSLQQQSKIPVYFKIEAGTDELGVQEVSPESVKLNVKVHPHSGIFMTIVVSARNPSSTETASMSLKLARVVDAVVVEDWQTIGDLTLTRKVMRSETADAKMAAVEAGTTHTATLATTDKDNIRYQVAKVPEGQVVCFSVTTLYPPATFCREVAESLSETAWDVADLAIALPMAPIGVKMETKVDVDLDPIYTIRLPTKEVAEHDFEERFSDFQQVTWMESTSLHLPRGTAALSLVKIRIGRPVEDFEDWDDILDFQRVSLTEKCASATVEGMISGYDEDTGVEQSTRLVSLLVPEGLPVNSLAPLLDVHVIIIVDESGSMRMTVPDNVDSNLILSKAAMRTIVETLASKHTKSLRKIGMLGEAQRVLLTFVSFHSRAVIHRARVPLDDAVAVEAALCAVEAYNDSGGTNFFAYASLLFKDVLSSPESRKECLVQLVMTDGGAHDLEAFLAEHRRLALCVHSCRVVVLGFGAWVDEQTARRVQTDGYALVASFAKEDVVAKVLRLLPRAIARAATQATLTVHLPAGTTLAAVAYADAAKSPPEALAKLRDDDDDSKSGGATRMGCVEAGETVLLLLRGPTSSTPKLQLNGSSVPIIPTSSTPTIAHRVLELTDNMYQRDNVAHPVDADTTRQKVIEQTGLRFGLTTSHTKVYSSCRLPAEHRAPREENRPKASPLLPAPLFPVPQPYRSVGLSQDSEEVPVYRSLGVSERTMSPFCTVTNRDVLTAEEWMHALQRTIQFRGEWSTLIHEMISVLRRPTHRVETFENQTTKMQCLDAMLDEGNMQAASHLSAMRGGRGRKATVAPPPPRDIALSLIVALSIRHNDNWGVCATGSMIDALKAFASKETPN